MTRHARWHVVAVVFVALLVAAGCGSGVRAPEASEAAAMSPTSERAPREATSTTSTTAAAPPATTGPCTPASAVAQWPLHRRLAQLIMPTLPGDVDAAASMVSVFQPGGVFLADGSLAAAGGVEPALAGADPVPPFVAIDEEGGRVQRLEDVVGAFPSARQMAATMTRTEVRNLATRVGTDLRDLGITMDFAPVADVSDQPTDAVIGDRSFSNDPTVVTRYAGAFAAGLRDAGVVPVLKHFPGHGHSSGDSHEGAVTTPALDDLRADDLVPYETLLDKPVAVMMGHLDVPGLTEAGVPTSLSPAAVRLLREDYGFDGMVITDDLGAMGAVTARFGEFDAPTLALAAGVDMVLIGSGDLGGLIDHLEQAVAAGTLPETRVNESVLRVLTAKAVDPCAVVLPG